MTRCPTCHQPLPQTLESLPEDYRSLASWGQQLPTVEPNQWLCFDCGVVFDTRADWHEHCSTMHVQPRS